MAASDEGLVSVTEFNSKNVLFSSGAESSSKFAKLFASVNLFFFKVGSGQ